MVGIGIAIGSLQHRPSGGGAVAPSIPGTFSVENDFAASALASWAALGSGVTLSLFHSDSDECPPTPSFTGLTANSQQVAGLTAKQWYFWCQTHKGVLESSLSGPISLVIPYLPLVTEATINASGDGLARIGDTLYIDEPVWSALPIKTYQWQKSDDDATWTSVTGEVSSTIAITEALAGKYLRCRIVPNGVGGNAVYSPSLHTRIIGVVPASAPIIVSSPNNPGTEHSLSATWIANPPGATVDVYISWSGSSIAFPPVDAATVYPDAIGGLIASWTASLPDYEGSYSSSDSASGEVAPIAGYFLSSFCNGVDLVGIYADGNGGSYNEMIEAESPSCST